MGEGPVVVGINRTQDGSIAVACGPSTVFSLQKERISRHKHHWGRLGDLPDGYLPHLPMLREPVDLVVEGYSSDPEIGRLSEYHDELESTLQFAPGARLVRVSHHLSHLYSAFPPSPFASAAGLVVDAQGSPVSHFSEEVDLPPGTGPDLLEISSFYRCTRDGVECLAKQLWGGDWAEPAGLGCFYSLLTRTLWPEGEGNEGKVMDVAPFGDPAAYGLPELEVREHEVFIPDAWLQVFSRHGRFRSFTDGCRDFAECANLAAAGQRVFENALLRLVDWLHTATGEENLTFAGGTALNCSANGRILRESRFRDVFIPPGPHGGGTAVGCALYGMIECLGRPSEFRWVNDFLGPEPRLGDTAVAVATLPDDLIMERPEDLASSIVDLLARGRVVGLHQGRSESGPRALGNRSIIGDPRRSDMRDYINVEVKGREWFRPLATLVLADHAERLFDVDRPAPFMQYAADVRPEYRERYPGITHVDGSARLQTVEPLNTPFLYDVLSAWHERTGSPVLINTSLGGPGDPLTETPEQSIETLRKTNMHALAMPPYLIRKRSEPPVPGTDWQSPGPAG